MENFNFIVKGKSYITEDLRIGKIVDLWKLRAALSMGTYGQLYRMSLNNADEALMVIDIEAFFSTFCPEFIKSLKPGSIRELGVEDYLELKEIYVTQIAPWLEKVEDLLKKKSDNV
jgi:hypothetical protein